MAWSRITSSMVRSCLRRGIVYEVTCVVLVIFLLLLAKPHPAASQDAQTLAKHPDAQIDLSAIGFHGLSASARLAAQANVSLDFVDDDHLLLTFNPKKMFTRLPDCPSTHDDRLIHAVVLSVPDGKVAREADWYLHDHERYLWALGSGHFLLRRLNTLYLVDSE